jgi:ribosomal protein S18 acetylase RimI-like enzyme
MTLAAERGLMPLLIREYRQDDAAAVRRCVVELQEHERTIDPTLRSGDAMADDHRENLLARCAQSNGRVFVAQLDGAVVGFVCVLAAEAFTALDEPPGTYGLVTDLAVLAEHRGRGIGRQLLQRAEAFARSAGASQVRIGVLSQNVAARRLYLESGFVPHLEVLRKRW